MDFEFTCGFKVTLKSINTRKINPIIIKIVIMLICSIKNRVKIVDDNNVLNIKGYIWVCNVSKILLIIQKINLIQYYL